MVTTPPHLAELALRRAGPGDRDEFFGAAMRAFHTDFDPADYPIASVFEPPRCFGYAVDGRWISTCGAWSRVLTVPGGAVPVAAVTLVAVQTSYRRRGLLRRMMQEQLADIVERGIEPVALLWASESSIYGRFGYGPATFGYELSGSTRDVDLRPDVDLGDGSVGEVERDEALPLISGIHSRLLPDRVGALDRPEGWANVRWEDPQRKRNGAAAYRFAVHFTEGGAPDGYVAFRVREVGSYFTAEVEVIELDAVTPAAYARLARFVLDLDLVTKFRMDGRIDEPLLQILADPRRITAERIDCTYLRLVDVRAALEARTYAEDLDIVIGVRDAVLPANDGSVRLAVDQTVATTSRSRRRPDLTVDVRDLGSAYLGSGSLNALAAAGLIEERTAGSVAALSRALSTPRAPFCPDFF